MDLKATEVLYNLPVTVRSTFGNIIMPGNYIDIYLKAVEDDTNEIIYGKFIENIKVLAVKDSSGNDVFSNSEEKRTPSMMLFGLEPELNVLLNKASYLTRNNVEIIPVPHGVNSEIVGDKKVSSEYLREFINSRSVDINENQSNVEG